MSCTEIKYKEYKFFPKIYVEVNPQDAENAPLSESQSNLEENEFVFKIEAFKYPFYLFESDINLFQELQTHLLKDCKASLIVEENIFCFCKKDKILTNEEWELKLNSYLVKFCDENFAKCELNNLDPETWFKMATQLIPIYAESNDLSLVIKSDPEFLIRIEGNLSKMNSDRRYIEILNKYKAV